MRPLLAAPFLAAAIAYPTVAAAPQFQTAAPVAYLEDLSSGAVLFERDADRRMPPASMAKMMTAYVAFDLIKKGELKLDQKFTVRPETWRRWHGPQAGSTMFLSAGEQVSIGDLLNGIIVLSGNDACVVLAEGISGSEQAFVERMNRKAKEIGLNNSNFGTSNGWPDGGVTYVTARDTLRSTAVSRSRRRCHTRILNTRCYPVSTVVMRRFIAFVSITFPPTTTFSPSRVASRVELVTNSHGGGVLSSAIAGQQLTG